LYNFRYTPNICAEQVAKAREDHSDHGLQNQIRVSSTGLFLVVQEIPYFIQVYCTDKIPSDYLKCFS